MVVAKPRRPPPDPGQLARIEAKLDELLDRLAGPDRKLDELLLRLREPGRTHYPVEEFAAMIGRHGSTVRAWCRAGRVVAVKRPEKRGQDEVWFVPAEEVDRYRNEGLLPPDPQRNRSHR